MTTFTQSALRAFVQSQLRARRGSAVDGFTVVRGAEILRILPSFLSYTNNDSSILQIERSLNPSQINSDSRMFYSREYSIDTDASGAPDLFGSEIFSFLSPQQTNVADPLVYSLSGDSAGNPGFSPETFSVQTVTAPGCTSSYLSEPNYSEIETVMRERMESISISPLWPSPDPDPLVSAVITVDYDQQLPDSTGEERIATSINGLLYPVGELFSFRSGYGVRSGFNANPLGLYLYKSQFKFIGGSPRVIKIFEYGFSNYNPYSLADWISYHGALFPVRVISEFTAYPGVVYEVPLPTITNRQAIYGGRIMPLEARAQMILSSDFDAFLTTNNLVVVENWS